MSSKGTQIIFRELFSENQRIQVPLLQRDYVQGRDAVQEIREEFLDVLFEALDCYEGDSSQPLNLDFIYGSIEGDKERRFIPLDGQQRLTTFFLLHWYLSWRDSCWDEFENIFSTENLSKFTYKVRSSSTEYFNAIVNFRPQYTPDQIDSVSDLVSDQPWYFRHWRLDPTIQSSLVMLNAIHLRFKATSGFFARITNADNPAITFQLLDMENFGLSDDLYIKMNARGKPLTAFETFKARFEQDLKNIFSGETRMIDNQECSFAEFFSYRLDTTWADFFWPYRNSDSNTFDEAVLNLFRAVIMATRSPENELYPEDFTLLRSSYVKNNYFNFHKYGWLDRGFC